MIFVRVNILFVYPIAHCRTRITMLSYQDMEDKAEIRLLKVANLKVSFLHHKEIIQAVKGVSFTLSKGETIAIVGESGSGKTTTLHAITGLIPDAHIEGSVHFQGIDLLKHKQKILGKEIGMVFQDPAVSLNPTMKIRKQIEEGLLFHRLASRAEAKNRALALLHQVEIPDVLIRAEQYPHELSGGQKQRVAIAVALACHPQLLIADEPTTALDTHTKMQVIFLIQKLQKELQMSTIWVSHDLDLMGKICDKILIFYKGQIVEEGDAKTILSSPKHPYTQMLINSKPTKHHTQSGPIPVSEDWKYA